MLRLLTSSRRVQTLALSPVRSLVAFMLQGLFGQVILTHAPRHLSPILPGLDLRLEFLLLCQRIAYLLPVHPFDRRLVSVTERG